MKNGYISQTQLKRRGWTVNLIAEFLPEHDKKCPHPLNSGWEPQKLYSLDKVEEIEQDECFQRRKAWATGFKAGMKEAKRQERERRLKE